MYEFDGKNVVVVGLGKSGVASAKFCVRKGANVFAVDKKSRDEMLSVENELVLLGIETSFGKHDDGIFAKADIIVASPGVPLNLPELEAARSRGVKIIGEMELACAFISAPVIAITGTNGKTTTTTLISHLLDTCNISHVVGGNIGTPAVELIESAYNSKFVVLEVSSFQIDTSPSLKPWISILLNVTPDHLDRHESFSEYVASKAAMFERTMKDGFGIYNVADEAVAQSVVACSCNLIPFDATGRILSADCSQEKFATFDCGDLVVATNGGANRYNVLNTSLNGLHNRENMLSAIAAVQLCGGDAEYIAKGLASFKGLPHRIEFVGEWNGVSYFDDSKGTNVGAVARALEQFAEPVILIAGGLSKGVDFSPLKDVVKKHVKLLVLIGEATAQMESTFAGCTQMTRAASMEEAVKISSEAARAGDVVLLSPACASFDMFKDYAHRGKVFSESVKKLFNAN